MIGEIYAQTHLVGKGRRLTRQKAPPPNESYNMGGGKDCELFTSFIYDKMKKSGTKVVIKYVTYNYSACYLSVAKNITVLFSTVIRRLLKWK